MRRLVPLAIGCVVAAVLVVVLTRSRPPAPEATGPARTETRRADAPRAHRSGIRWTRDLGAALERARTSGRLVLLYLGDVPDT